MDNTAAPTESSMNPAMFSAATQAGSGILGSILASESASKQRKANREMANQAYAKDLEMWNRSNMYNSPEMQMERLRKAGLNPALVYGQGAVANTGGQIPKYNVPQQEFTQNAFAGIGEALSGAISSYQDFTIKQAQTDNLRQQNKILKEEEQLRHFKNRFNLQTEFPRVENEKFKAWLTEQKGSTAYQDMLKKTVESGWMMEEQGGRKNYFTQKDYQLEALKTGVDAKRKSIEVMDTNMEYKQKQLEFFLINQFGPLVMKGLGSLGGIFKGLGGTGFKPKINQGQRQAAQKWETLQRNLKNSGRTGF